MKIVIVEDDIKLREELKILLDNKTYQGIIIKMDLCQVLGHAFLHKYKLSY